MGGKRCMNFGAGPAKLPTEVLTEVQSELLDLKNGMSILEISHRSKEFLKINDDAQNAIRTLLNVPQTYKIIFVQGGGTGVFAAVAMNLMNRTGSADYVVTGTWSSKAAKEAEKYGKVNLVFPKQEKAGNIPDQKTWTLDPNASYLYYCDNETVDGVEFPSVPKSLKNVPIVADMSSNIMTKQIDVSKFGMIFGGAQKNIGPAGVTFVIIREDLLGNAMKICPSIMNFTYVHEQGSVPNTPATFSVYVMGKVLQWIIKEGGVVRMEELAQEKSQLLYQTIKESKLFYYCPVYPHVRSKINVPFKIGGPRGNEKLEAQFLEEAEKLGMYQLKGHRLVGGIRASLYNAVTLEDVKALVALMKDFQQKQAGS